MNFLLYFSFSICLLSIEFKHSSAGNECRTPYDYLGYCIPLLQCASLLKILHTASENPNHRAHLRGSRCGNFTSDAKNLQACCPIYDLETLSAYDGCDVDNNRFYHEGTFIDQYPWTVRIIYQDSRNISQSICSGALINNEYVLTAAHCVHGSLLTKRAMQLKSVRLGEWNIDSDLDCLEEEGVCADPTVDIDIISIHIHENYTASANNTDDIALIRLSRKIPKYTDFIRPICITDEIYSDTYRSSLYTVNGWGFPEKGLRSDIMMAGKIKETTSHCERVYQQEQRQIIIDPTRQLCAGGENRYDTCFGNGGAPLMQLDETLNKWILLGIASFGPDNCDTIGYPAVYTRVREYHFWIIDTIFKQAIAM